MAKKSAAVSLSSLPPVEHLKLALASVASGSQTTINEGVRRLNLTSTDKLRKYALFAREWSKKCCAFCGTERPKSKAKDGVWEGYELCSCLQGLTGTYRQNYPWQDVPALLAKLKSGEIGKDLTVFSDVCATTGCGTRFSITAEQIRNIYLRHGAYNRPHFCLECARAHREAKLQKAQQQAVEEQTLPRLRKKEERRQRQAKRGNKNTATLTTTLGEALAAKLEMPPELAQA